MTERAQALEAAVRALIEPMCERVTDNGIVRQKMLVVAGDDAFDRYRRVVELLAVQPPPPVGSPTTEHEHDYVAVELCRHCLRTEADITGECHHCDEGTGARCWWCFKLKSTPVAPAGASESPSEMDSGIVLLVSAASAASGYLERQQPDLAAWLWNAVQLVLNSQSAPVSPVEPTPGCGCDLCRAPQGSAILTTIHAPTGAPAPCVWRPKKRMAQAGCPESRHVNADGAVLPLIDVLTFHVCPYCKAPLTVER